MDHRCRARWHPVAWQPDILARRITAWLSQAPLILHDADDAVLSPLPAQPARQVRYLRHTALEAREGVPRMQALVALTYAALCMAGQARHLRSAIKQLVAEIERQILPDGGHVSRNPGALIELLLDLLPLRQAFAARNIAPPPQLNNAIDRMMPMMRFFRHGDGNFAHFNGMGPTLPDLMATILAYDDARGAPLSNAPHSGYQRVEAGDLLLLMDTGGAAADRREPGGARRLPGVRAVARHAAHRGELRPAAAPTAKPGGRSRAPPRRIRPWCSTTPRRAASSKAARSSALLGTPIVSGPDRHPGVARGARRRRSSCAPRTTATPTASAWCISARSSSPIAGNRLDGEDLFVSTDGDMIPQNMPDEFAVRFHLHPAIKANKLTDGHGAMLMLPNREVWTFNAYEDRVELEESVYLSGTDGPRRAVQIVIYGRARKVPRVHWTFAHQSSPAAGGRPRAAPKNRNCRCSEPMHEP